MEQSMTMLTKTKIDEQVLVLYLIALICESLLASNDLASVREHNALLKMGSYSSTTMCQYWDNY